MNLKEFIEKMNSIKYGRTFNIPFLCEWYDNILKKLNVLLEQEDAISHPRHRGDAREEELIKIIKDILPTSFTITKGYAINSLTNRSLEQDCMICKKEYYTKFVSTSTISYIPIESVLASIEIKSSLSTEELRKSIINCASLKALMYKFDKSGQYADVQDNIVFSVFAYRSDKSLKELIKLLEELNNHVPKSMCINMIYVLNKGLILPCDPNKDRYLNSKQKITGSYEAVDRILLKNKPVQALPFLWYLANILDHIITENENRKFKDTLAYFFEPLLFQQTIDEQMKKQEERQDDGK
ncbi:MAG: DUF6602 domain-containing protein [Christensenellales bacterium]|jgi:hypothetical protein